MLCTRHGWSGDGECPVCIAIAAERERDEAERQRNIECVEGEKARGRLAQVEVERDEALKRAEQAEAREAVATGLLHHAFVSLQNVAADAPAIYEECIAYEDLAAFLDDPFPAAERLLACERFAREAFATLEAIGGSNASRKAAAIYDLPALLASDDAQFVKVCENS